MLACISRLSLHLQPISKAILAVWTHRCAGVVYKMFVVAEDTWKECIRIAGVETVGIFKRTVVRADVDRLNFPPLP